MTKTEFLLLIDELIEAEPGTLTGTEILDDLEVWDSLVVMEFIALVDERFDTGISPKRLSECETVNDLIGLLNGSLQEA